ncbi:MAG: hypothetical protein ABSC23_14475 [Bryobacteraceae bacterium]
MAISETPSWGTADGILLYPSTGATFSQEYVLHGHRLRVLTLDPTGSPHDIDKQMFALTAPAHDSQSMAAPV